MQAVTDTLVIPSWANGPDDSANGGWTAGLLARHVPADRGVAVSLRVPPPIGRELAVSATGSGADLHDPANGALVADARPHEPRVAVPDHLLAVTPSEAAAASAGFPFRERHPFPRCVCCGIARPAGAPSLAIHCGPLEGVTALDDAGTPVPVFADRWEPSSDLAERDEPGHASLEACWSALDCPSAAPFADPDAERPIVLARMAARLDARVRIGEPHVLLAWQLSVDGRKHRSASALVADGRLLGCAEALWIEVA